MTAIRTTIVAGAADALASPATGALEIEVMPTGDPATFPALHLFDDGDGEADEPSEADVDRQVLQLSIEGYVEADSGLDALAALNALYAQTITAIYAMADASSLIETISTGRMRINRVPLGSERRLAFSVDLFLTYPTRRGDPTA